MTVQDTSLETFNEINKSGKRLSERVIILRALNEVEPLTSAELASMCGIPRHHAASRLSDMLKEGVVLKDDKRECLISKRKCYTWTVAD